MEEGRGRQISRWMQRHTNQISRQIIIQAQQFSDSEPICWKNRYEVALQKAQIASQKEQLMQASEGEGSGGKTRGQISGNLCEATQNADPLALALAAYITQ